MWIPGLGPMTIYLLWWQIKVQRTISLLKDELSNKQITIDNLTDVIKNFTVIENKYTRNKEQESNVGSKEKNDVVRD